MRSKPDLSPNRTIHLIPPRTPTETHAEPPGSLAALERCLADDAAIVEIDILPLADGSFALLHDRYLDEDTNGTGDAITTDREEIAKLNYKDNGTIFTEKIGFLEDAIDLLKAFPQTQRLQLDLKPYLPLTGTVPEELCYPD